MKTWPELSDKEKKEALERLKPADFRNIFSMSIENAVRSLQEGGLLTAEESEKYLRQARESETRRGRSEIPFKRSGKERNG